MTWEEFADGLKALRVKQWRFDGAAALRTDGYCPITALAKAKTGGLYDLDAAYGSALAALGLDEYLAMQIVRAADTPMRQLDLEHMRMRARLLDILIGEANHG
jgi:hypothetical protein